VSWALTTAAVEWGRGQRADAIEWVRRAAASARAAGDGARASELEQVAGKLDRRSTPASAPSEIPAPSARAILESIHETLEEAASQGLVPEPIGEAAPLVPAEGPASTKPAPGDRK
jgi:hypothetical protein